MAVNYDCIPACHACGNAESAVRVQLGLRPLRRSITARFNCDSVTIARVSPQGVEKLDTPARYLCYACWGLFEEEVGLGTPREVVVEFLFEEISLT